MFRCNLCLEASNGLTLQLEALPLCQHQACHTCRRLESVDKELEKLHESISALLEERRQLKYHFNTSAHPSIVNRFPREISDQIFSTYVRMTSSDQDSRRKVDSPLVLSAVCNSWRQHACSSPALWTALTLSFTSPLKTKPFQFAVELLSRSAQLPLDIHLFYVCDEEEEASDECPEEDVEVFRPFAKYLNRASRRWHNLVLDLPSPFLELIQEEESPSGMHYLSVRCTQYSIGYGFDMVRSAPKQLLLNKHVFLLDSHPRWENMTVFHAVEIFNAKEISDIWEKASHLESCRLDLVSGSSPWDQSQQRVTVATLTDLDINFQSADGAQQFFSRFTLPSLTSLRSNFTRWKFANISFLPFLQRSNCCFELLELRSVEVDNEDVLGLFRYVTPTLHSLCIGIEYTARARRQWSLLDDLNEVFSTHLTLNNSSQRTASVAPILPCLTTFKLSVYEVSPVWHDRRGTKKAICPELDQLIFALFAPSGRNERLPLRPLHLVEVKCGPFDKTEEVPLLVKNFLDHITELRRGGVQIDLKAKVRKGYYDDSYEVDLCQLSQELEREGGDVERVQLPSTLIRVPI
ncbi:hypothetical protein CVT26_009126 [Gymnopilus dilepis]|uniref:F-box domain-containing protein n=1 Tax=Gymnopilus dilepis TaxID=231916 RepID=A0A409YRH0_9AGAR|nr:hypothetical protein CVT26_009126 [Gymnopilus dilepis]